MDKCGIYVITSPSGKGYVGSSVRLAKRRTRHFYELRNNSHHCERLQRAWNKYDGKLNFVVIEYCRPDQLVEREQFWLDHSLFVGLYNSDPVAGNQLALSDQTKAKISVAKMGQLKSELTKERMRKPKSAAHAAAISAGKRGKVPQFTLETRAAHSAKVSEATRRRWSDIDARVRDHIAKLDWMFGG